MVFTKKRNLLIGIFLTTAFMWLMVGTALAQDSSPAASADDVTPDEVNKVARELWCPLCSGVRLDVCELKACDQMKEVIAIKLAEGEDTESIKQYFVGQYGPQVLGEPPREGFNWLAWILPVVALVIGGVFLWRQMGRMMSTTHPVEATAQALADAEEMPSSAASSAPQDEYEKKLDEELTKYG
jgi:cytochrome c-type biogenesis protein CcmH